jgi:hypothetical protein
MVRAGQAASVGGGEGGGKKEDSGGGPGEKKAGGDKPGADTKESGGSKESGGDNAGAGDGGKAKAAAPAPAADKGPGEGSAGGGKPPAAPTIQVFDVDVQKVVASTPLIQAFDKPLPSAQKIQATVEVQQAKMSEGKMESLGVEIVAVKADGDVLVGAPKVAAEAPPKKEEPKADAPAKKEDVVAKKEEVAAKKEDGGLKPEPKADAKADPKMAGGPAPDKLDISTAAGPGAGAPPAPSGTSVAAATPPPPPAAPSIPPPPVNIGQIVNPRSQELAPLPLTVRANDAFRAFGSENPDFGFSVTAGGLLAGHSIVTDLLTPANKGSGVNGNPYTISFGSLRIVDRTGADVTRQYNLTKVSGLLNLSKAEQMLDFKLPSNLTFGADTNLRANAQGGEVSFKVVSGPATIDANGKLVATSGTGTVVVKAVTPGDANYRGAEAQQTITLAKAGQSVRFTLPGSLTFGADTSLSATKLDSAVVSFEVLSGPAKIENGKLVPESGTGTVVVKAVTPGDANYRGAEAQQTINLAKAGQALNFEIGTAPTFLTGSTRSIPVVMGGSTTVSFSINETDGRAILTSGSLVIGKIFGANSFTLKASATGDGNYVGAQKEVVIGITPDLQGIVQSNPLRGLVEFDNLALQNALDNYFYFKGSVAGSPGALAKYFVDAPMFVELGNTQKVELGTSAQDFDFFAAQATKLTQNLDLGAMPLTGGRSEVFFYATRQEMGLASAKFFGTVSPSGVPTMSYDNSSMDLWEGSWADWRNVGGTIQGGVTINVPSSKEKVGFVAGTGGISIQGVTVNANGAALEVLASGDLLVQATSLLGLSPLRETSIQSLGVIQMGATTEELAAMATLETSVGADGTIQSPSVAQEALQEEKQVRIESSGSVSTAGETLSTGIAVIRSATGLEMRDVVIRGFGQIELAKGLESSAPRVLVSGSSVRDFKIKELVGAFINADSKIQMAALDASGELAGTMVVQNGLPVNRQLAGVLDKTITDSRKNLLVDAQTVSLAAKRLEFQNTTIAAMSAINARANTVLLNNANFTVIAQNGMINFYTQQGLVNRTFGSDGGSDNGKLNFTGVNNFRIGNNSFTVQDQATLNQHYGNNIVDMNQNFGRPEAGKVNVLKM